MSDPRIDAYIAKSQPFARPIMERLRAFVHATVPNAGEAIKWNVPHFTYRGKNLAGMSAFKAHCAFAVHNAKHIAQYVKITDEGDIPLPTIAAELKAACATIDQAADGPKRTAPRKPASQIPVPQDFAAALREAPAASLTFEAFPPSQRAEYVLWIAEAKREETRNKRIKQALEWLAEGKRRNWKYER
jgi:uncharacterized protein YdeI (YjbR/CyaY-like superfamily)